MVRRCLVVAHRPRIGLPPRIVSRRPVGVSVEEQPARQNIRLRIVRGCRIAGPICRRAFHDRRHESYTSTSRPPPTAAAATVTTADSHPPTRMNKNGKTRIQDALERHEAALLADWVSAQKAAPTYRSDLIKEGELRDQSREFLRLLA